MKQLGLLGFLLMATLSLTTAATAAAADWTRTDLQDIPASQTLRGYGRVATAMADWQGPAGEHVGEMRFQCANVAAATTLTGKFLADLEISTGSATATLAGVPVTRTAAGFVYAGCVRGAESRIVFALSDAAFTAFAAAHPEALAGAVAAADYPAFLDRFDRYGWGSYGLGGFNNYHDWMTKVDGKRTFKDPTEDAAFMIQHKFRFEPWLDPTGMDTSDGIIKNTENEWMIKLLTDAGMPFSFRLYGNAGGADWTARRFGEYMEQPADWMMCGFIRPMLNAKSAPHLTWFNRDIHRYMAVKTMELMAAHADNPLNMGWMQPHGELEHQTWYDRHDDYSVHAQRAWRAYLQKQGVTLAEVAEMVTGDATQYGDWAQVQVPEFASFAGLNGMVQDLNGTWFWRRGRTSNDKNDTNYPGLTDKWYAQPLDASTWQQIDGLPGSDEMYTVLDGKDTGFYGTTWFRRSFTFTPPMGADGATKPVYFYWFPITEARLHSGDTARYNKVFVNGQPAGETGMWGALDVSALLKPGNNEICVQLFGAYWKGRSFLSTETPAVYPYLGKARNRLFLLWQDWRVDAKYDAWSDILDGMRQVDPNRPIKFMAPLKFRADRWTKLAADWGGFGHFTGEGIWYFPWYKRYGFLYDVPGSSESSQPNTDMTQQNNTFRRVFLAGLNAHEPVFLAQSYIRVPELRAWWVAHNPVLKRMGKYDISPKTAPQVLLYRSTHGTMRTYSPPPYPTLGESTREINNAWDWDLGRGSLQTLGHSMLYLDDQGLADGKMNGFSFMMDSGNETVPERSIDALAEWVKAGGTYVALPFTGRNTELEPDSWAISRLTGCSVGAIRALGTGSVTIAQNQSVFRALAGKTFPDTGKSMDYIGNNHNLYSVELVPGADDEVLATYDNGKAAIVRHKLGAGSVIVLGSAFWRNCEDRLGLWWPEPIETDFLADLFAGLNVEPAVCTTDDRLVWAQPYRSNNGLDAVTCLVSWHEEEDRDVTVTLRLPRRPAKLVSHGVDGDVELPFEWADGIATTKVHMPAKEVKVIDAVVHEPADAIAHWWNYQQKMWHQLKEPSIDFSPYTTGKWADPTLDLRAGGAEITLTDPATTEAPVWTPSPVSILNFWGAKPNEPVWLRKSFRVPTEWQDEGGRIFLVSGSWNGPQYEGTARLTLNGEQLHDFAWPGYRDAEFDVTKLLKDGDNTLMLQFKGDKEYQGVKGQLYLYHWSPPAKRVPLAGNWDATDADHAPITVALPGDIHAWDLARTVFIPEDWRGKYRVRLYMDGNAHATGGAWVNDRVVRRHHHSFNTIGDIDITNFLRYGEANSLRLIHNYGGGDRAPAKAPQWDIARIELHLHPVSENDAE